MAFLFARYCQSNGKMNHLVLSSILLALVQITGCGGGNGNGNPNSNGNSGTNNASGYLIDTVAGNGTTGYSGDGGMATQAELNNPSGVSVDSSGNIYIADAGNNVIREVVAATGVIQTVAGHGTAGYSGDGGKATQAELNNPSAVSVDVSGNIYIADTYNAVIREVVAKTGVIQTVAGNGTAGYSGDGGKATQAELNGPFGVSVDVSGNLYIADNGNWRIREVVARTGTIQTVAIQPGLDLEEEVFVDTSDDIFIASANTCYYDPDGNLFCGAPYSGGGYIQRVSAGTHSIQTVAGNGTEGYSGDGGMATQAELGFPSGVSVDVSGNIYIGDTGNNRIREVAAATGVIQTIAGNGKIGFFGDGGSAIQAELSAPTGLAIDSAHNILFADSSNQRIRKLVPR